jgi:hypothetical protein
VCRVAAAYALWGEGFYAETASEIAGCPGIIPVPPTVAQLGLIWPRSNDPHNQIVEALLEPRVCADPSTPLAYFLDVLVWNNEKQINRRPRDLFLRLYGTIESVIFFAFHAFIGRHPERLQVAPEDSGKYSEEQVRNLRNGAIKACERNSMKALRVLRGDLGRVSPLRTEPAIPDAIYARAFEGAGGAQKLGSSSDLRHKAVHWLAPVPADAAINLLNYIG